MRGTCGSAQHEHIGLYFYGNGHTFFIFNFADHGQKSIVGTVWCNLKKWLERDEYFTLFIGGNTLSAKWCWDRYQQSPMTLAPSLDAADIFLMGRVGSPAGFASEKTVFVKKVPKAQIYSTPNMPPRTDNVAFIRYMFVVLHTESLLNHIKTCSLT